MSTGIILTVNIVGWILFIIIQRAVIKRTVRPRKILSDIEAELDSILTELNGTTERNIRLIEESVLRLREEIRKADGRLKLMQGEGEKITRVNNEYSHLASRKPISIQVVDEAEKPKASSEEPDKQEEETVNQQIIRLHRQGLEPRLIATRAAKPLGEVELIISLSEQTDR